MNERLKDPANLKLFQILLGSKAPGRNVEQHDYFFGIATTLKALVPGIRAFWPEAGDNIHIDGWREVNVVDGHAIKVTLRNEACVPSSKKLFFINLGGYQQNKLEEQHYTVLTLQGDKSQAVLQAKASVFFKTNSMKGANSHIDEKYGIDVDDVYRIEDVLAPELKQKYQIVITPTSDSSIDKVHLGYFPLHKIEDFY